LAFRYRVRHRPAHPAPRGRRRPDERRVRAHPQPAHPARGL